MHFSFLEKLAGSVLICAWLVYGSIFLGNLLVRVDDHTTAAVAVPERAVAAPAAPAEPDVPFEVLLAQADPAAGERAFSKCRACHTIEEGGPNRVGPNLWNIVGGPKAHMPTFNYSAAIAGMGGEWTYANLDGFLENPRAYAPGNRMTFAGIRDGAERAAIIAYLRANTVNPPPLPEPPVVEQPAEAPEPAAPAGEAESGSDETAAAGPGVQMAAPGETAGDAAGTASLGTLLATADAAAGAKVFGKCKACHTIEQGGPNRVGPNLWNVVGADKGAKPGFSYSTALTAVPGTWSYEDLDAYLQDPKGFAPGNKMTFAGLKKPEERAAMILYLREHTENPLPLP